MEKCLISQLGVESNDASLPVFGKSEFEFATDVALLQSYYGFNIKVLEPITLTVDDSSYFTDSTGTENRGNTLVNDDTTGNIFVKSNSSGTPIKVTVDNKYAIKKFYGINGVTPGTSRETPIVVNGELFEWATGCQLINIGGAGKSNFDIVHSLQKLIRLDTLSVIKNYFLTNFTVNDLAVSQIENGRDYTQYPTLHITTSAEYTTYFNGTAEVNIPHNDIYIVFKSGGYELHDQTADGTLLYDSLA